MACKSGEKYGRLTLLDSFIKNGRRRWLCRCDCGREKDVLQQSLISGNTKSCGCLQVERNFRHGGYYLSEYSIWIGMKSRCYYAKNRDYTDYGGRGIRVCDRWLNSFPNFLADMGSRPSSDYSLDRIDFNGNYEPSNCRWLKKSEQNSNKRSNFLIAYQGETLPEIKWAKRLGLSHGVIKNRLKRGWSVEKALTTPSQRSKTVKGGSDLASA